MTDVPCQACRQARVEAMKTLRLDDPYTHNLIRRYVDKALKITCRHTSTTAEDEGLEGTPV